MKKILLTILAVLALGGMAMAQTAPSDINLHRNEDGTWSFIMPGRNLVMSTETFSTNDTVNGHYLAGVPEGWLILALGDTVPVSNDSLRRTTPITEGTPVTIVPTGNLRRIKSITLVDEVPPVALAPALENGATVVIAYTWNPVNHHTTYFTFTNNGGTYSCQITGASLDPPFSGSLTLNGTTLALSILQDDGIDNLSLAINFDTTNDTYSFVTKNSEWYYSHTVSVNGTDITSKLTEN